MTNGKDTDIAVIGLWHQGVVGAACLADWGFSVRASDPDSQQLSQLKTGKAPLYEPGLDELLQSGLDAGRLTIAPGVAEAVEGASVVCLMFDTPVDDEDQSDLSGVYATVEDIAPRLSEGVLLYVTAQVPVGTCDKLGDIVREANPGLSFDIAYSPENLRLGQAIERFRHPPLPLIGATSVEAYERAKALFPPDDIDWQRSNVRTAEMTKHALNAYLATTITFANELGNLCDAVGADGSKIASVLRMEERIGKKAMLLPGLGFSGGTLARDMQTLRNIGNRSGLPTRLLDGAWDANHSQNGMVVRKLKHVFGELSGVKVAVLGLTYKPDTSTLRRSAALEIIRDICEEGGSVTAHDPKADREELKEHRDFAFNEDAYAAAEGADALVLITPWKEYRHLDFDRVKEVMAKDPIVMDTANMYDGDAVEAIGFRYMDIGRGRKAGAS